MLPEVISASVSYVFFFLSSWQSDESTGNCHNECNELKKLTAMNKQLNQRVKELMAERESVSQDSQDLLNGMQVTMKYTIHTVVNRN